MQTKQRYKKGEYLISEFMANRKSSTVEIEISHKEGNLKSSNRSYKVCIVSDKGIIDGSWTKNINIKVLLNTKSGF